MILGMEIHGDLIIKVSTFYNIFGELHIPYTIFEKLYYAYLYVLSSQSESTVTQGFVSSQGK